MEEPIQILEENVDVVRLVPQESGQWNDEQVVEVPRERDQERMAADSGIPSGSGHGGIRSSCASQPSRTNRGAEGYPSGSSDEEIVEVTPHERDQEGIHVRAAEF